MSGSEKVSDTGFTFNPELYSQRPVTFGSHEEDRGNPISQIDPLFPEKPIYTLAFEGLIALVHTIHDLVFRCFTFGIGQSEESQSRALCRRIFEKYSCKEDIRSGALNERTLTQDLICLQETVRKNIFQRFFIAASMHDLLAQKAWETISTRDFVTNHLRMDDRNFSLFLNVLNV